MDGMLHQLAERLIYHAMARDGGFAGKAGRNDRKAPVGVTARRRPGMARVLRALVDQVDLDRLQGGEALLDLRGDRHGFSSSMYFARNADWTTMNRSISPM